MDDFGELVHYIDLVISSIAIFISFITLAVYICVRQYMIHPGHLLFAQIICEMNLNLHRIISIFNISTANSSAFCRFLAFGDFLSYLLLYFYVNFLAVEIIIKHKYKASHSYKLRSVLYHVFGIVCSVLFVFFSADLFFLRSNRFCKCTLEGNMVANVILTGILAIATPIVFYYLYFFNKDHNKMSYTLRRYRWIVFCTLLSLVILTTSKYVFMDTSKNTMYFVLYPILSTFSVITSYIRLHNTKFFHELASFMKQRKKQKNFQKMSFQHLINDSPYQPSHSHSNGESLSEIFEKITSSVSIIKGYNRNPPSINFKICRLRD